MRKFKGGESHKKASLMTLDDASQKFSLPFDAHKLKLFCGPIPVIKIQKIVLKRSFKQYFNLEYNNLPIIEKELLSGMDVSLRKYTDPVITIDHHDFGIAVGINRVIGKSNLVPLSSCIHNKICLHKNLYKQSST